MKHLIFHLNVLADPAIIRVEIQIGTARMLGEIYGDEQAWFSAYSKVLADWDSYHADLNFSGEDGMADMREARFRIMRALFRIAGKPEPSQEEIHALADKTLSAINGDVFFQESHDLLKQLAQNYSTSLVSYFPQAQLEAMVKGAGLQEAINYAIGADSFERFEMNQRYFEFLLNRLKVVPSQCLYVDKQKNALEAAAQVGIQTFLANDHPRAWIPTLISSL